MPREIRQDVMFVYLQLCVVHCTKKNLELQEIILMEDEVQDDCKVQREEQKMRGDLWV